MSRKHQLETRLIHAGEPRPRVGGAANLPIFRSTIYEHQAGWEYHDILYPRLSNLPNHVALGEKLAALEGAEAALVTASGMAAISTTLLAILGQGGHLLAQDCLYGGTRALLTQDFPALGLSCDFIDPQAPASWTDKLRPNTRAIYVETITNPLMQIADHVSVVEFARAHRLTSLIDNTFASPVNFRPLEHGFDLCLHSATKYLNGHSDVVAGAVIGTDEQVRRIKRQLDHLGGCLDPQACYLLDRGLKTLALRVRQQNHNAQAIAELLGGHRAVERVLYPGLASHPQHDRARELFEGFGGMLAFEPGGGPQGAERLIAALELPVHSASLGGVETLITRPATSSHAGLPAAERQRVGISDGLLRLSVGIEAEDDLLHDLARALDTL